MLNVAFAEQSQGTMLGSYFQEINDTELLGPEEEQELAQRVREGDIAARNHLVRANLRLVVSIARRYCGRGLSLQDLIQEGNLGLIHAVELFDPEKHIRFSTYAKYWIQQSMQRALESLAAPVRVPSYANHLIVKWRRARNQLQAELGRPPSEQEIAQRLKLTERQLAIVQKALRIFNGLPRTGAATNVPLEDLNSLEPADNLETNEEMQHVLHLLDRLDPREATVLRLHFGLDGKTPLALHEIGEQLHLTRERVRQIEKVALNKMRNLLLAESV